MRSTSNTRAFALLLAAGLSGLPACTSGSSPEHDAVGTAQAAVTNVPSDGTVACIAVTATGTWSTTRSFDVTPGQGTVFTLTGIPVGTVRFDGDAYAVPCAQVTGSTAPTWLSAPVYAPVVPGQMTAVTLDFQQVGAAGVGVDFDPEPACRTAGQPCLQGSECCSGACAASHVCVAQADGCVLPSDCPGAAECRTPTCNAGVCGLALASAGTPAGAQTLGDCAVRVCDGAGAAVVVADASDVPPDDGNPCTLELCQGGVPSVFAAAAGTACNAGGGQLCDGAGACVACLSNADCPSGAGCIGGLCIAPTCTDAIKNGAETDVDCGGPACVPCGPGGSCLADADCKAVAFCEAGVCVPRLPNGSTAASAAQCASGFLASGVCCNSMCGATCLGCVAALTGHADGECSPILAGHDPPGGCGGGQTCNGMGGCVPRPTVVALSPAGNTVVPAGPTISVTFDQAMDPTSLTPQSVPGACSGSIQVSRDGFASCAPLPSPPTWSAGNTVATLTAAPGLLVNSAYKIRVISAKSLLGIPILPDVGAPSFLTRSPPGCSGSVVVSQVYGGGGLTGAVYRNDFVELHNRGDVPANLNGLSLQTAAAGGTTWTSLALNGIIPPGGYFLVQLGGGANGAVLPTPDQVGTANLATAAAKVALVVGTAVPAGSCASPAAIDFVGYGSAATCAEGAPTANLAVGTAAIRVLGACADTNLNSADFAVASPTPRNTSMTPNVCPCGLGSAQNESGLSPEADFCAVQFPLSLAAAAGTAVPTTYGRVFEAGVTGLGVASANVRAQLGYGPPSANPEYEPGWTWIDAAYNAACSGCGSTDEYAVTFTAPAAGTYAYVYRVSLDQGQTWTYCDTDGSGSGAGLSFELQSMGSLVVTP